jgi:hypothetical protein
MKEFRVVKTIPARKVQIGIFISAVLLLAVGAMFLHAQSEVLAQICEPMTSYQIQNRVLSGGDYRLTTQCRSISNEIAGSDYRLMRLASALPWGNCCCSFLPVVKR